MIKSAPLFVCFLWFTLLLDGCTKTATYADDQLTGNQWLDFSQPTVITPDVLGLNAQILHPPPGTITEYGFKYSVDGSSPVSLFSAKAIGVTGTPDGKISTTFDVSAPGMEYGIIAYAVIDGQYYYSNTYRYTTLPRGQWKKAAPFPGEPRSFPFYFVAAGKGYMGGGWHNGTALKDCWEFDPVSTNWTQLPDFPGKGRSASIFFSLGDKGYVGAGAYDNPLTEHYRMATDFYRFDALSKTWTQLQDFPARSFFGAEGVCGGYSFSLAGYGFTGGGHLSGQNDCIGLYRYDTATDVWTVQSPGPLDYHNYAYRINNAACFVIADTVFVGTGVSSYIGGNDPGDNFFRYQYSDNSWQYMGPFPGGQITGNVGFTNSGFGYIGFDNRTADLWQYKYTDISQPFKRTTRSPDSYLAKGGIAFTFGNQTYMGLGEPVTDYWDAHSMYIFTPTR